MVCDADHFSHTHSVVPRRRPSDRRKRLGRALLHTREAPSVVQPPPHPQPAPHLRDDLRGALGVGQQLEVLRGVVDADAGVEDVRRDGWEKLQALRLVVLGVVRVAVEVRILSNAVLRLPRLLEDKRRESRAERGEETPKSQPSPQRARAHALASTRACARTLAFVTRRAIGRLQPKRRLD